MQHAYMYRDGDNRVIVVERTPQAFERVDQARKLTPMFDGQPVSYSVARACIREYGGMWLRADGLRRFKPGARANQTTGTIRA